MNRAVYPPASDSVPSRKPGDALKLKICGMKYAANIAEVSELFPDFMGFIFYSGSKRFVGEDFVMPEIPADIKKVGVFVNDTVENISEKVKKYKLDFVQLHGEESAEFCKKVSAYVKVIKAFGLPCHTERSEASFSFDFLNDYIDSCNYFLFDTKTEEYGGSGKNFDWSILKNYKLSKEFFLSGGIDINIFSHLPAYGSLLMALDVNSKFEIEPGLKDINKLKIITTSLRGAK